MNNVVTTNTNTNVVVVTAPGPAGVRGPVGPKGDTGTISGNTGVNSTGSSVFSGSVNIIGTLSVTGSTLLSGTALLNGAPILTAATLATDRIATTGVTASVSTGNTVFTVSSASIDLFKVTNTGTSGSFIGAFSGSGANLFNIPASGITGLNLSQIASTTATASISAASGFRVNTNTEITGSLKVTAGVSGSFSGSFQGITTGQSFTTGSLTGSLTGIGSGSFSGSFQGNSNGIQTGQSFTTGSLTGSFTGISSGSFVGIGSGSFSGSFQGDGAGLTNVPASGIVGLNLSRVSTGSVTASVAPAGNLFTVSSGSNNYFTVSGSRITIGSGSLFVSQSINAYNINVGTPTSNAWQSGLNGSYFNNFTTQTDASEILRFIAGLLSASAPDASPNTKTFASITQTYSGNGTGTVTAGYVPQSSSNADILYLLSKSFTQTGSTLFPGKTLYNNSGYTISYSSVAGGSTIVSSSADAQLFGLGLLTSGGPTQVNVSGTINWFYSDNNSETSIATSQSQTLIANSTFSTTNGITLAKINTANPAVIPAAYQDGKFSTVFSNGLYNGGRTFTSVSSSGWYHLSASVAISSGSSPYSTLKTVVDRIFYAPLSNISTNVGTNTKGIGYSGYNTLTAASRSLSGAPYLNVATWTVSSSVTGLFNPLFGTSATLARQAVAGNISIANPAAGAYISSITTGLINTANTVYDSTGVTARNTATIPFLTDIIRLTGSVSLSIGTGNNIAQTGLSPTTFTIATYGTDKDGTEGSALNTLTIPYHSASTFSQPLTSGSLGYYGQAQGYDGGTLTGGSEAFTGESYRVQITNKFLSGSYAAADAWSTAYGVYNLGALDLQVKPGYLVRPGGTYGYWLTDPDNTKTYKYYARAFQRSSGTAASSVIVNVGKTLVNWQSTTSGVAVALMFKSSGPANGYSTPRIYDPSELTSNLISGSMANDNFKNPFTNNIALYGNTGGNLATTTYTVPLRGADGMILDGTLQDFIILIRYTGDQAPVSSITVSYT
jgi:hypothetical protein